jgi:transcriptional regulator with XRE-family HTH domain
MPDLGHTIRAIREARKLSLADVAKAANIGVSFLSLIEHNDRRANSDTLRLVARALRVPEDLILTSAGLLPVSSNKKRQVEELKVSLDRLRDAEAALRRKLGVSDGSAKR